MKMVKQGTKPGTNHRAACLAALLALSLSGSCSLFKALEPAPPVLQEDFSRLDPKAFPEKIRQLEEISQNDKRISVRTRALFCLALANMHYRNPSPDYAKAEYYLERYIAIDPKRNGLDELVAWKSVLHALDSSLQECAKLEKSYAQLNQQYDRANRNRESLARKVNDLGQMIENQKKEIQSLKETIKELDAVQQEIEKKRKAIKKSSSPPS